MALDWLPVYPTPTPRQVRHASSVHVGNLDPIINPPPPTDWPIPAVYPDQLRRAARVLAQPVQFRWPMVPISDLRWLPRYPVQLRRKFSPQRSTLFTVLGAQQAIPTFASWRPTYPNQLRRSSLLYEPSRVTHGQSRWVIDPSTLLKSAKCVEWTAETVSRPEAQAETFRRPAMTCLTQESGFLLLEDGGFLLLEDGGKFLLEDQTANACETFVRPQMIEEDWC